MATIKSFTDLSQSRVLAKILPLESADMHYNNGSYRGVDYTEHFSAELMPYQEALHLMEIHKTNFMFQVIPCWSLAALLSILPKVINNETLFIETSPALWHIGYRNIYTARADNVVDACYEMVLKLNELNLL